VTSNPPATWYKGMLPVRNCKCSACLYAASLGTPYREGTHLPSSFPSSSTVDPQIALIKELREILKVASCPNFDCTEGAIMPEGDQCQWCAERDRLCKTT
jgi:hypothetical protein